MTRDGESVLQEAARTLDVTREEEYGSPVENFGRIGTVATFLAGKHLTAEDCACVLLALKVVRAGRSRNRDSLVDLAAYAEILQRIREAA